MKRYLTLIFSVALVATFSAQVKSHQRVFQKGQGVHSSKDRNGSSSESKEHRKNSNYGSNKGAISKGKTFAKNVKFYSASKSYYLVFQTDGNLVLYNSSSSPVWSSNTAGKGSKAIFQNDGNLVVYNRSNAAVFASKTKNSGSKLTVQDDGNLVIYNSSNAAVWSAK
ncbi:MAG: hypothetical protein QM564_11790 [Bergeyella sp.]